MDNKICGYGLAFAGQALDFALVVCEALGRGEHDTAVDLLMETCAQETHLGTCLDRHLYSAGTGLMQIDKIRFDDIKRRARPAWKRRVMQAFAIDVDAVKYRELALSPLLSMIFARLGYKQIPELIPSDREGRAEYWKRYYNTSAGKGCPEEYLANARAFFDALHDTNHVSEHLKAEG